MGGTKLPTITGKALVRALQRIGFLIARTSGSHVILRHDDGRSTSVPVHGNRDIPIGTLKRILRDAKLAADDLAKLI